MLNRLSLLASSALALVLVGCGGQTPPPATSQSASTPSVTTPAPTQTAQTGTQSPRPVNVSDEIRQACGLPPPKEAPKFDFDKAELSDDDRSVVANVAKCLTEGPLKGKAVELVGRADARGEEEYNMALGARRAEIVKKYMSSLGVETTRIVETSRGKMDAKGTDEETYKIDRRVDINLKK